MKDIEIETPTFHSTAHLEDQEVETVDDLLASVTGGATQYMLKNFPVKVDGKSAKHNSIVSEQNSTITILHQKPLSSY